MAEPCREVLAGLHNGRVALAEGDDVLRWQKRHEEFPVAPNTGPVPGGAVGARAHPVKEHGGAPWWNVDVLEVVEIVPNIVEVVTLRTPKLPLFEQVSFVPAFDTLQPGLIHTKRFFHVLLLLQMVEGAVRFLLLS